MKYSLHIDIGCEKENIEKLLKADIREEANGSENGRSKITLRNDGEKLRVEIASADATALRASVNGVLKILQIYEKTKGVVK